MGQQYVNITWDQLQKQNQSRSKTPPGEICAFCALLKLNLVIKVHYEHVLKSKQSTIALLNLRATVCNNINALPCWFCSIVEPHESLHK